MKTKSRTQATALTGTGLAILLSLSSMNTVAWAGEGPGSTGGGLSDARGDLLDFGEFSNSNVKPFHPTKSEAFQQVLLPLLKKVNAKVPGSARKILVGLEPNMEWFLSELPIANSSDECKLVKEDSFQIAKQVDGEVALSKSWMENHDTVRQAGLILHELIMFQLSKGADECSTRVRRAVRAVFNVDQLSAEQLQFELARVGIYGKTAAQAKRILQLSNELIQAQCKSVKLAPISEPKQTLTNNQIGLQTGALPKTSGAPAASGESNSGGWAYFDQPSSDSDPRILELFNLTVDTMNSPALVKIHSEASFNGFGSSGFYGGGAIPGLGPVPEYKPDPAEIARSCNLFNSEVAQYRQEIAFPAIN
jgi:hypothetical protein